MEELGVSNFNTDPPKFNIEIEQAQKQLIKAQQEKESINQMRNAVLKAIEEITRETQKETNPNTPSNQSSNTPSNSNQNSFMRHE